MKFALGIFLLAVSLFAPSLLAQAGPDERASTVSLGVPSGAPLRLYLTRRVSKRLGAPVEAKLMEPLDAFDREVIPAGTVVLGKVSRTQPVTKWQRIGAILNGDFTPLRRAQIEFTNAPKLQVGSGPGRGIAHFSWRAGKVSAMRCPKPWSQSRRLLYTTMSWEAKMEILGYKYLAREGKKPQA